MGFEGLNAGREGTKRLSVRQQVERQQCIDVSRAIAFNASAEGMCTPQTAAEKEAEERIRALYNF